MSRLIVLPFRLLRADPEVDFLAYSLADAVTSSLSGLGSLVVRSTLSAGKFSGDALDLQQIAREADVDVVLSGTLLRAGSQVRLSAQLAEAPGGALLWSHSMQVGFSDIFQLHDALVHNLVDALSLQLTAREHRLLGHDVPANAKAYEFFLRGNEIAKEAPGWMTAVELYKQCVDLDPRYAPAWARLGRVYRLLAKYRREDSDAHLALAEQSLDRALTLNPDLSLAQMVLAQMEVDGGRALAAMVRLLRLADHVTDPDLLAGLCHACRYCGLLDASIAAYEHALRLDPKVRTSVVHTYFVMGDYQRVVMLDDTGAAYIGAIAMAELGRAPEAVAMLRNMAGSVAPRLAEFLEGTIGVIEGRGLEDPEVRSSVERAFVDQVSDPEGVYYAARNLAKLGEIELAQRRHHQGSRHRLLLLPRISPRPVSRSAARRSGIRGGDEPRQEPGTAKPWPRSRAPAASVSSA